MKRILGLDLGTNSIGWAVIKADDELAKLTGIEMAGSRIIPMDAAQLGKFNSGTSISQTSERTGFRGIRRLNERNLLRRERLLRILELMQFLPEHFSENITRYGKYKGTKEPKIAWKEIRNNQYEFIFKDSFHEMVLDFKKRQPDLFYTKSNGEESKIPYDWTIYYLRNKALKERITKEELAWILLNFNQKRGYYQLRGEEDDEKTNKVIEFHALKVVAVEDSGDKKGKDIWYNVHLENGWIYRRPSSTPLDWVGKIKEFIVTTDLDENGEPKKDKEGNIKRSFRSPKEDDWTLLKKKTEFDIEQSHKTVGAYIYEALLTDPTQKIRGKLIKTIERKFYKAELKQILEVQKEFHDELKNTTLYQACIEELYPNNGAYRSSILKRDFTYLFVDDIIFYQRPLKSKKSLISNCPYEERFDKEGQPHPIKCIAKSNPIFQEFRLWQFISNLKIYEREKEVNGKLLTDVDVTKEFIGSTEDIVKLFDWLNNRKEIEQNVLFGTYFKIKKPKGKESKYPYRWNYVEDKSYPCNETRALILNRLEKSDIEKSILTYEFETELCHILYSVDDKKEIEKALKTFARKNNLGDKFIEEFKKYPSFKNEYGAYAENATKKLSYPCNETHALILNLLEKSDIESSILTYEFETALWHILYSVDDKKEIEQALKTFARKNNLNDKFIDEFKKFPPFKKEYGAYSEKAIKKLLPLMRMGNNWDVNSIDSKTKDRIDKIISGEYDEKIKDRVRDKAIFLNTITQFQGLPLWLACYIVYGRHSEAKEITRWSDPKDIDTYLKEFKQHSLRNPIVEQVVTETLRTVRDIWSEAGTIDEIHVELGREMKNPSDKRAKMTQQINENENTNLRIKALLMEFAQDGEIEGVRPYSPSQQEILRIYEDYALANINDDDDIDFLTTISKTAQPTTSDIHRYKLWLEQKYRSPYTGAIIPLSRLFTSDYEIEHVIPQSRYFDDSFSNKVICEAAVNKLKDNTLGYEFIKKHPGEVVALSLGKTVKVFTIEEYERFIKDHYSKSRGKMKKLLLEDIPDGFIERQLNDSRYISKLIKSLLSNIVREEDEQEAISKHVITCNGGITDRLKRDWGINDVWNKIILPRFIRMNKIWDTDQFTTLNQEGHLIPNMPIEYQKGFNKKRIDHRHHAMDAIVIACATRNHINLLNNEAAMSKNCSNRYFLSRQLRRYEKITIERNGVCKEIEVAREFIKPWEGFNRDVYSVLENIIVSFKQNLRVINKTTNWYQHFEAGKKIIEKQSTGDSWAIRKPMHKDTVFGKVNLRKIKTVSLNEALKNPNAIVEKEFKIKINDLLRVGLNSKQIKNFFEESKDVWQDIDLKKIQVYYFTDETKDKYFATRKNLDSSFDRKRIEESVTDTGIQKILLKHLSNCEDNPEMAFSPDGIDLMNRTILELNDNVPHKPIHKVRCYEKSDKFAIGETGQKSKKFVEAAKGTNLFYGIYEAEYTDKESGEIRYKRVYATIPLNEVIARQKEGNPSVPLNDTEGNKLLFSLSPGDLVYVPTKEQIGKELTKYDINKERIYKLVSVTGNESFFILSKVATSIIDKKEFSALNKLARAITDEMIKEVCIPIKLDRLGNITNI